MYVCMHMSHVDACAPILCACMHVVCFSLWLLSSLICLLTLHMCMSVTIYFPSYLLTYLAIRLLPADLFIYLSVYHPSIHQSLCLSMFACARVKKTILLAVTRLG